MRFYQISQLPLIKINLENFQLSTLSYLLLMKNMKSIYQLLIILMQLKNYLKRMMKKSRRWQRKKSFQVKKL